MNQENSFHSFRSAHVELGDVQHPPIGRHNFTIKSVYYTNDRIKTLKVPTLKDKIPQWKDPSDQIAVVFWCEQGVITRRFHAFGYKRRKDILPADVALYDFLGDATTAPEDLYAVRKDTGEREKSPERTAQCAMILNQLFTACGLAEGSTVEDLPNKKLSAEVVYKPYAGDPEDAPQRKDIKNFRPWNDNQVVDLTANVELEEDKF